ncbi:MAG: DUF1127 domain-containing protein [Rhodospirillales bacterium]
MTSFATYLRTAPASATAMGVAARVLDTLLAWQNRATERRRLFELSDHELADMGLDRATAIGEADKPFWRP